MSTAATAPPGFETQRPEWESRPDWLGGTEGESEEFPVVTIDTASTRPPDKVQVVPTGDAATGLFVLRVVARRPPRKGKKAAPARPRPTTPGMPATFAVPVGTRAAVLPPAISPAALPLSELMALSATNREAAIDRALDHFDDLLIAGQWPRCDADLAALDTAAVRELDSSVLVSILGITLKAKPLLPRRPAFYGRVTAEMARRKGRRYANGLLKKYR